jgi:DNA modification methylase
MRGKPLNGWLEADRLIPKQYYDWVQTWAGEWFRIIKPGAKKYGQEPDNIFHIQSQQSDVGLHPTQKPLKLMELLIELTTIEEQKM